MSSTEAQWYTKATSFLCFFCLQHRIHLMAYLCWYYFLGRMAVCLSSARLDLIKVCGYPITEINYPKCLNYLWNYLLYKHSGHFLAQLLTARTIDKGRTVNATTFILSNAIVWRTNKQPLLLFWMDSEITSSTLSLVHNEHLQESIISPQEKETRRMDIWAGNCFRYRDHHQLGTYREHC